MFPTKLTPESKDFIASSLALGKTAKDIQNDLKTKFNIDISIARIGQVQFSKRGSEVYAIAKEAYLKNIQKDAAKFIQHKEKRQLILERLLEEILSTDPSEFGNKFSTGMRERIELALKVLKAGESEDKVKLPQGAGIPKGSLLQFVNKQDVIVNTNKDEIKHQGEVIDVKQEDVKS